MKRKSFPIFWILAIVLASQGAIPGVVMCVEQAGHIEFEVVEDNCCHGDKNGPGPAGAAGVTTSRGSEADGSCGPCTDTPVSPIPVTKPIRNVDLSIDGLPGATLAFDIAAIASSPYAAGEFVAKDTALIPVKTTALLI